MKQRWLLVLFPKTDLSHSLAWQAIFALVLWCAVAVAFTGEARSTDKTVWASRYRTRQHPPKVQP
jgi:hypothetical protein